jgi:hypothetical protein
VSWRGHVFGIVLTVSKIWAKATSITGTGAEAKPHAIQIPLNLDGTIVNPGDLVFSDAVNGVVIIPQEKVLEVIDMLPKLMEADDKVKEDVAKGMTVKEAFKLHRGWGWPGGMVWTSHASSRSLLGSISSYQHPRLEVTASWKISLRWESQANKSYEPEKSKELPNSHR